MEETVEKQNTVLKEYMEYEKQTKSRHFGVRIWSETLNKDIRFYTKENALRIYVKDKIRLTHKDSDLFVALFLTNKSYRKRISAFTITAKINKEQNKLDFPDYKQWLNQLESELPIENVNIYSNADDLSKVLKVVDELTDNLPVSKLKPQQLLVRLENWIVRTTEIIDEKIGLEFVPQSK